MSRAEIRTWSDPAAPASARWGASDDGGARAPPGSRIGVGPTEVLDLYDRLKAATRERLAATFTALRAEQGCRRADHK